MIPLHTLLNNVDHMPERQPNVIARVKVLDILDSIKVDDADRTALDVLLSWYDEQPSPKNIAWVLDTLIDMGMANEVQQ